MEIRHIIAVVRVDVRGRVVRRVVRRVVPGSVRIHIMWAVTIRHIDEIYMSVVVLYHYSSLTSTL